MPTSIRLLVSGRPLLTRNRHHGKVPCKVLLKSSRQFLHQQLLLSPHPGQVKAELNSLAPADGDAAARKALEDRIHHMLFTDQVEDARAGRA